MNAIILLIPILLLRYALLGGLSKEALKRAVFLPPMDGKKRATLWIYLISNIALFLYLFFIQIRIVPGWFYLGLILFVLGTVLYAVSIINFARPNANGVNQKGLYRVSRHPMYVAFFIYFLGCVLLTQSLVLLAILLVFQISSHWIILSEESWCVKEFGEEYITYMKKVRRYI